MKRPLAGVRVVELGHVMAGPVCGLMLADLGADVVKIERLPGGDATRGFVPPEIGGESAAFAMLNRGKRGAALDLRNQRGREALRLVVGGSDVLIENFRPGTMERMGLGYGELSASHPALVYCQITGFGRTGPLADQGGFDLVAQGYSGLMSITGEAPSRPPVKVGGPITDITAGILAALGVASALFERRTSGRGRRVDTSLFEAGIVHTYWQSAVALGGGGPPVPLGSAHPLTAPYQAFETEDGWITVGASNTSTWNRLAKAVEMGELASDERFLTNADRMANLEELLAVLAPIFRGRSSEEWLGILRKAGVPAGPVATIGEMLSLEQTAARRMVVETDHPRVGPVRGIGCPIKFGAAAVEETVTGFEVSKEGSDEGDGRSEHLRPAPLLGEHTREILGEAGLSPSAIERLIGEGCAVQAGD